jgi:acetolactate synthase-1/2/3 large subunit
MNGSDLMVQVFLENNIDRVFLFPGGTIAPIIDSLDRHKIEIICTRAEQGAGFAALAYSKLSNAPRVGLVSSGPGATNLVTCVADAYFDNVASIFVTGQVGTGDLSRSTKIRQRGFQEVDTPGLMKPITKAVFSVTNLTEIPNMIKKAFQLAQSGRPGPVVIDFPIDLQRKEVTDEVLNTADPVPVTNPAPQEIEKKIDSLLEKLKTAQRPLIIAGNGIRTSNTIEIFRSITSKLNIPVTQSMSALGVFPTDHELALGFHGHTGNQAAGMAIYNSDFILVLGSRLDVRQTGTLFTQFAPNAFIVHVDIDDAEIDNSRVPISLKINTNLKQFFRLFETKLKGYDSAKKNAEWYQQIASWKTQFALNLGNKSAFTPQKLIDNLNKYIVNSYKGGKNIIYVTGVGSHQQWAARHLTLDYPKKIWMSSTGLGTMGYDLPAAIGSQFHSPDSKVICLVGDGSIQMNIQELAAIAEFKLPIIIFVINNNRLGIVSQFQNLNWGYDKTCGNKYNPDFHKIALAYGLSSLKIDTLADLDKNMEFIINHNKPILVQCDIDEKEDIDPMLLANQRIDEMWTAETK